MSAPVAAANAGQWWPLRMGLGPIFKHHHWPVLAAAADARCVYSFKSYFLQNNNNSLIMSWSVRFDLFAQKLRGRMVKNLTRIDVQF